MDAAAEVLVRNSKIPITSTVGETVGTMAFGVIHPFFEKNIDKQFVGVIFVFAHDWDGTCNM